MPPVIAVIQAIGALIPGIAAATTAATVAGTLIVASAALALRSLIPKVDMGVVDTDRSRQTTVRSTIEPRKLIYGETMVSGVVSFAQVNGTNNKNLHQVIAIAGHKLTSIDKIFFDDYSINLSTQVDGSGDVTLGKFAKKTNEDGVLETMVHIETRDGSSTQTAYSDLVTAFAGTGVNAGKGYESTHRGDNVASIYTRWTIHEGSAETWDEVGGIQNIKAVVKGKAVYDPRLDVAAGNAAGANPTTAAYITYSNGATTATHQRDLQGQNPALILADYLMDATFGLGVPSTKIDWAAVITAADACDFLVPIPTSQTQKRFFGSGVIFGSDNHRKSISKILSGMNGDLIYSQGKYIIKAGIHEAASLAFTEDDLAGDFTVKTSIPRADRYNTIKGMFIDPDSNYKMTEFAPRTVSGAVARDNGEVLEEEIKLTFTSDRYVAQRIAIKQVHKSFLQTTLTLPVNLKGMKVAVGDRITLALNDFATISSDWNPNKEFKVIGWSFSESGSGAIELNLVEDDSSRYVDPAEGEYNQISNTGVITSSLADVPLPTNFTATAGYNSVNLAWTNPTNIGAWEQIWIYASDTTTPPATPIEKFRGTAFTHQIAGGTAKYYWIQAVKYPLGATPASGSTNTAKSALVPFNVNGVLTSVTALKIANAVMADDSINTAQIIDDAVGSDQIATALQSSNWSVQAQTGWRIEKSGDTTFNNTVVRGNISATTGTVGGFTIGSTDLIAGDGATRVSLSTDDGISLGNNTFANAPFRVTRAGALTATNATITGSISATTGAIGGFSIGSDYIADAADSMGLASTVTAGDDVRFWAGDTFANRASAPFRVTEAGALNATNATISGAITATTLTVAEANITNALTLGGGVLQDGSGNNLTTTTTLNANQQMSDVTGVLSQAQHAIPSFYRIDTDDELEPSNTEFNGAAGRLPKVNDIVITTDTTTTPESTYGWTCTAAGTASTEATWEEITDFISGDLLVDGTITADQIAANAVTAAKINVTNLEAIQSNLGNITAGTLKGGNVPDANAAPSGSESGSFFDLTGGKFVVGDASRSLLFDGSNMTMTGDVRVKGTVEADTLIVNNSFQFVGKEFFIASGVEAGGITADMLSQSAVNLLQGSLAQSVGGSNGDFKEGTGTFTTSGGSIVLGTSGDLFDHGELAIDLEANFSISWNSTTNYGSQNFTLQFQVSTDGTTYTNVGSSHTVTISTYDLSSYYPGNYYVHYSYTDITETISAGSLTNNTDYYIRALISSVPTSVTGQTPSFTFAANEGVTGVTSTGGNADTLDNLDSTAFLRSNVDDTFDANLTVTGNLTVQGTTTTVDTDNLTVKDNNITLNYSTGDSSSTANNAGITIQDAVNSTTDASILWKTASDSFEFSHLVYAPQIGVGTTDNTVLADTQVYIKQKDGSTNLMRWGSGDVNNQDSYRLRVDQSFKFITNSGSGDTLIIDSSNGNIDSTGVIVAGSSATPTGTVIGNVRSYGSATAYVSASHESGKTAFFGVDTSDHAMFGALTNHDAVIRANNTEYLRVKTNGNVNIVSGRLEIGGVPVITSARKIEGVTFDDSYYTDEFGKSLVGNFGQFQGHATYGDFNTAVSMWGWNYVNNGAAMSGNAPVNVSTQWYRNRVALGDVYGYGNDSTDYWLEMAYPRYGNGTTTSNTTTQLSKGSLWVRTFEGGTAGSWSQIGSDLYNGLSIRNTPVIDSSRNLTNIGTISSGAITSVIDSTNGLKITANSGGAGATITAFQGSTNSNIRTLDIDAQTFVVNTGAPQGTTATQALLIDSSQNATFAGTISSGAITSTGAITGASFINTAVRYISNQIQSGYGDNSDNSDIWINYTGYQGGTTYFRDFRVGNGKQAQLFFVDGSAGNVSVTNALTVGSTISSAGITSSGRIDISSTNSISEPYAALGITNTSSSAGLFLHASNGGRKYEIQSTVSDELIFYDRDSNAYRLRIMANGNLKIENGNLQMGSTSVIDSSRNITNVNITASGYISQGTGQSHYFRGGTDGNWRIGSDIVADSGGLVNSAAIQMIVGGGSSPNYGFQIFGHTTNTDPAFEVLPQANAASSITNIRGKLYINNTQVIDNSKNITAANIIAGSNYSPTGTVIGGVRAYGNINAYMSASDQSGRTAFFGVDTSGYAMFGALTNHDTVIRANNTEYLRVKTNSNVQIVSGSLQMGSIPVIDNSRNLTNINLVKFREGSSSFYISPTNVNTLNGNYGAASDSGDMWINYRGYQDGWAYFRDLNIGNGKGTSIINVDGSAPSMNLQNNCSLKVDGLIVISGSRQLQNVTFASGLYTVEYGPSLVGNFGQFQAHSTYSSGFNASVAMWGWNYVQGNANAPNTSSTQWYRNRVSLGDAYGYNYDSGDYWLEMAYPRYNQTTAGHLWLRTCENGNPGGWTQVGANIIGNFTATGNVTAYSDERLKDNIKTLDGSKVLQMRGVSFTKDGEAGSGVIAQELELVASELVHTSDDEMGTKSVAYGNLVGYLIENAKQQQSEIDELKALVKQLMEK